METSSLPESHYTRGDLASHHRWRPVWRLVHSQNYTRGDLAGHHRWRPRLVHSQNHYTRGDLAGHHRWGPECHVIAPAAWVIATRAFIFLQVPNDLFNHKIFTTLELYK